MKWIVQAENEFVSATSERNRWNASDQFRANTGLKEQENYGPVLRAFFLRFSEVRFAKKRKAATREEIKAQEWSLNPERYIGVELGEPVSEEVFEEQLQSLNDELKTLHAAVSELSHNRAYSLEILVPPAALLEEFCELADTFESQVATLRNQIKISVGRTTCYSRVFCRGKSTSRTTEPCPNIQTRSVT